MSTPLLEVRDVSIKFGGLTAITTLNLDIHENQLFGLIGPNGAGKTTAFNLITGVYQPTSGTINFRGQSIGRMQPSKLAKLGIARTFQNIRLFGSLSVADNVRVAAQVHRHHGYWDALWRGKGFRNREAQVRKEVCELLDIFDLGRMRDEPAKSLPYGDQRRLEIVRALATRPKLLLLDEPAAGMNPSEKEGLMKLIRFIQDRFKIAIMLVEHDMKVVMGICERIAVLEYGVKIAEGTPSEMQCDPKVIAAYLGTENTKMKPVDA